MGIIGRIFRHIWYDRATNRKGAALSGEIEKFFWIAVALSGMLMINNGGLPASAGQNEKEFSEWNQLLQDERLSGALAGVSIRSAERGDILFEHLGSVRLRPASNMKLVTAAAALDLLGPDYRFQTTLYYDGVVNNGVLAGNIYVKGGGDPALKTKDIEKLAAALADMGIHSVLGNIVGDESRYDSIRYSVDLPWSDESEGYGAAISALSVAPDDYSDPGTVLITVKPGKNAGDSVLLDVTPDTSYMKIVNSALTCKEEEEPSIKAVREHGGSRVDVTGCLPADGETEELRVAVWEPGMYTVHLLKENMAALGISFGPVSSLTTGYVPANARPVAEVQSEPLCRILRPFLKNSNNTIGEMLVKEMGAVTSGEGSWEEGIKAMESRLHALGLEPGRTIIRDGSGISHVTAIPSNELTSLLFSVQKKPWFPHFLQALPVAGEKERSEGGTLRFRLTGSGGRIAAKTGTLTSVSSLSGYIRTKGGHLYIFSILMNNFTCEEEEMENLIDEMIQALL